PTVTFLGWQPDEVVRDHYRRCRALLFPGEEDFGIVPLEALSCGAPVIALGRGGAAETIDPRVGRTYTDPSVDGLCEAVLAWEAEGCPHAPALARHVGESYATHHFRDRLLGFLASVVSGHDVGRFPPAPHVPLSPAELPARYGQAQGGAHP